MVAFPATGHSQEHAIACTAHGKTVKLFIPCRLNLSCFESVSCDYAKNSLDDRYNLQTDFVEIMAGVGGKVTDNQCLDLKKKIENRYLFSGLFRQAV